MALNLTEPEAFERDPYGFLTNQISHIYLGFSLISLYTLALKYLAFWPDQVVAMIIVSGVYLIWWELLVQGWRGLDTLEDTFFFSFGTASYAFIDYEIVIERVVFFLSISWVFLLIGVLRRLK